MRLKSVDIKNFRLIEELHLDLERQTAILGGNGCGKSTVLRAIERFFGPQTTMTADDFFANDLTRDVEIGLTFRDFSEAELALFSSRIHSEQMSVTRVFEATGTRTSGKYYGAVLKHQAFNGIRAIGGAREKKTEYDRLRALPPYTNLPDIQRADQIDAAIEAWETENPGECTLGRDNGSFFGFTNVAKGTLQKSTNFVFIPAVRDVAADSIDSKGAVVSKLMELVVRSAIGRRQEVRDFQASTAEQFKALTDPDNLPELGELATRLSTTLQQFYGEAQVELDWAETEEFTIPLPAADVFLNDDGFRGPVDRKGHGLQRAFVVTLLQHLAGASVQAIADAEAAREAAEANGGQEPIADERGAPQSLPGLILAIEEPELYQHPTKQRHFARVLTDLSLGRIPGVALSTQVLFASHSPLFISLDRFDEVRIARRVTAQDGASRTCDIRSASLNAVARKLERVHEREVNAFDSESLRERLHVLDAAVAEGFFANLAVLVEGVSDRAAILATAFSMGIDLEGKGIAVLPVDGKNNLDRVALVFMEFEIPCYIVWDCDSSNRDRDQQVRTNRALQRLCGVPDDEQVDFANVTSAQHSCFSDNLETTMFNELDRDRFAPFLETVETQFEIDQDNKAMKNPIVMSKALQAAGDAGLRSNTLRNLVNAICQRAGV